MAPDRVIGPDEQEPLLFIIFPARSVQGKTLDGRDDDVQAMLATDGGREMPCRRRRCQGRDRKDDWFAGGFVGSVSDSRAHSADARAVFLPWTSRPTSADVGVAAGIP